MKTEAVLQYIQPFQSLKVSHFEESLPDLSFVMLSDSFHPLHLPADMGSHNRTESVSNFLFASCLQCLDGDLFNKVLSSFKIMTVSDVSCNIIFRATR